MITQEVFRETQAISFSKLSKLADGPQAYKVSLEEKESSPGLTFGSVVDILLTRPDSFDTEFYVITGNKPSSDMMIKFCEIYAETDDLQQAYVASGFKISLNAVLSKFQTEGKSYYDSLVLGKGKKMIDAETLFAGNQAVNALKTNPFTRKYFSPEEGIEILYQVPIIWKSNIGKLPYDIYNAESIEVTFKGIIDIVRIDHNKKTIEIVDIKTGSEGFRKAFWKYKLYLQGSMYYYGMIEFVRKNDFIKDYLIDETKFLYVDSNLYYPPVIYKMNRSDIFHGKDGYYPKVYGPGDDKIYKLKIKGYERLAAELDWHIRNDKWDYSYDVYNSNGEIEIDAFNPKF